MQNVKTYRFYQVYREFVIKLAWFKGRTTWPKAKEIEMEKLSKEVDQAYIEAGSPQIKVY
jgi:hypothetical protein